MMTMWTMIAVVSVAFILAGIFTKRGKSHQSDEIIDELRQLHAKVDALENDLRDRIETLERIVTNPEEDLKRQFEYLDKAS